MPSTRCGRLQRGTSAEQASQSTSGGNTMCFLRQTAGVTLLSALAALLAAAASPAAERTAPSILDGIGCPAHVGPTVAARHLFAGQVNGATQKGVVKRFPLL